MKSLIVAALLVTSAAHAAPGTVVLEDAIGTSSAKITITGKAATLLYKAIFARYEHKSKRTGIHYVCKKAAQPKDDSCTIHMNNKKYGETAVSGAAYRTNRQGVARYAGTAEVRDITSAGFEGQEIEIMITGDTTARNPAQKMYELLTVVRESTFDSGNGGSIKTKEGDRISCHKVIAPNKPTAYHCGLVVEDKETGRIGAPGLG